MEELMKRSILLVCIIAFIAGGCASTKISSFTDPSYRSKTFHRIVVVAGISNLEGRKNVESSFVKEFEHRGIYAVEGINIFPPTRTMSTDEMSDALRSNQIDGVLYISVGDAGVSQEYVPPTSTTTKTKGTVSVYGNSASYQERSKTTTDGGYTISKPWAKYEVKLFDAENGQNAWLASASTKGNAYANSNTVVNSFSSKTIDQLKNDGLIIEIKSN
jgi:hypothetical protein